MTPSLVDQWASHFGLAQSKLFAVPPQAGEHCVLLDGGYGSFAVSVTNEALWKSDDVRSWAWSSNLPHHLTVTEDAIAVTRWDRRDYEEFSRKSVEQRLDTFYQYLLADRVGSTKRVVEHVVTIFRKLRSLVAESAMPDLTTVNAFLALLARSLADNAQLGLDCELIVPEDGVEALASLPAPVIDSLLANLRSGSTLDSILLLPELAVRHAGSEIFQEAHFELVRSSAPDLFSDIGPALSRPVTRSGSHFTPPALARALTEQTLSQISCISSRLELVVLDPACGSGAFLQEAIHALQRLGFNGQLRLVGRDISPAAVSMANFAISILRSEWSGPAFTTDVALGDALTSDLPAADVVLMNPPFQSWSSLTPQQRNTVSQVLRQTSVGRPDYSMAFVTRMSEVLKPGGAMGTLVPASLTTMRGAESWRQGLVEQLDMRLLASLGDFNLFANALVQIAALVFRKPEVGQKRATQTIALSAANDPAATGEALRALRRGELQETENWESFTVSLDAIRRRPIWRLSSPKVDRVVAQIAQAGGIARINDLFDVRQGIRTGANKVFLVNFPQLRALPAGEQRFFRPAIMNESISEAKINETHWVFYPYGPDGLLLKSEDELKRKVRTYYDRFLQPNRSLLEGRSNIIQSNIPWWALSVRRSWGLDTHRRIVSKYFGASGGFALDEVGKFAVVQGFAWFPKVHDISSDQGEELMIPSADILRCYVALFNSLEFEALLEFFSPQVAGGQFDLSPRYVNEIPVPNFFDLAPDGSKGAMLRRLSSLGEMPKPMDSTWQKSTGLIVQEFYGTSIKDD